MLHITNKSVIISCKLFSHHFVVMRFIKKRERKREQKKSCFAKAQTNLSKSNIKILACLHVTKNYFCNFFSFKFLFFIFDVVTTRFSVLCVKIFKMLGFILFFFAYEYHVKHTFFSNQVICRCRCGIFVLFICLYLSLSSVYSDCDIVFIEAM